MASEWHYAKGGVQHGPVTPQGLKELAASGELAPTDLVWKEGLPEWRPASTLKGLFPEAQAKPAGPPPLPPVVSEAQPLPPSPVVELDVQDAVSLATTEASDPPSPRKPDFFDKARELAQKAKAKAEAFQKGAQEKYATMASPAKGQPGDLLPAPRKSLVVGAAGCGSLLALVFICGLLGRLAGIGGGPSSEGMTKQELIAKIDALGNPCKRAKLLEVAGEPSRTQTLDGVLAGVFWYYKCRDGMVQVVLLNSKNGIGEHNDESLAYISRINDY